VLPGVDAAEMRRRHLGMRERFYDELLAGRTDVDGYRRSHLRAVVEPWGVLDDEVLGACAAERDAHRDNARMAEGAAEAVAELRSLGLRLGVLTNGSRGTQRRKLEIIGLEDAVDAVCTSEEIGFHKPDPRAFAVTAEAIGTPPERTAMVGDNVSADIAGALGAGYALAIHVGRERPAALPEPALHVRNLGDALAILRSRAG
jgi:putative hydrolase of the HAD superfamily